jgi:hypothetical protein
MCKNCEKTLENLLINLRKIRVLVWQFYTHMIGFLKKLRKTLQISPLFPKVFHIFYTTFLGRVNLIKISFPTFTHRTIMTTTKLNNRKEKTWS